MCKAFFCCAPLGAATFRRGQSKKTTPPRLCFLLRPRRKAGEGAPRWAPAQGQSKKENTGPTERSRRSTGRKKKTYSAHPGTTAKRFLETNDTGHERKGATTQQKKRLTHCGPGPRCSLTSFPGRLFRPGPAGVFLFCCGPARTLTHSLRAWEAMPPAGVVIFCFFSCGPARTGWCFFLLWPRTDAHSLTVGWGDFGKARVVFFAFCCGPAEPGEPRTKCLVYYI